MIYFINISFSCFVIKNLTFQLTSIMKKPIILFIICFFNITELFAQSAKIQNTKLKLSATYDSLIVNYDLIGELPANEVKLNITDSLGTPVFVKTVTGDVGNNIQPGLEKTIYWNMGADGFDVFNTKFLASVTGIVYLKKELKQKKELWIPWLYIASAASATGGVLAHLKANSLYKSYQPSSITTSAEQHRKDVKMYDAISYGAFGAAGGLAIAGVVVHIKHNQKKKALLLSYVPCADGALMSLSCNF